MRLAVAAENNPACSALSTRAKACSGFLYNISCNSSFSFFASSLRSGFVQAAKASTVNKIRETKYVILLICMGDTLYSALNNPIVSHTFCIASTAPLTSVRQRSDMGQYVRVSGGMGEGEFKPLNDKDG